MLDVRKALEDAITAGGADRRTLLLVRAYLDRNPAWKARCVAFACPSCAAQPLADVAGPHPKAKLLPEETDALCDLCGEEVRLLDLVGVVLTV